MDYRRFIINPEDDPVLADIVEYVIKSFYEASYTSIKKKNQHIFTVENLWNYWHHYETDLFDAVAELYLPAVVYERFNKTLNKKVHYSDEEILNMIDKEFGQSELYMWSTYILPNGHFLNPDNSNTFKDSEVNIDYEHDDFNHWVSENFGWASLNLFDEYCVKMNVTFPYLALPNRRITQEQVKAIKEIVNGADFSFNYEDIDSWLDDLTDNVYNMKKPLLILINNSTKVFDLAIYNANDIIKEIMKAYSLGRFLNESLIKAKNIL